MKPNSELAGGASTSLIAPDMDVPMPLAPPANQPSSHQWWTDERVELLKKLWADGLSASQIAVEMGHDSRSAIIGKVHRLKLSGRRTVAVGGGRKLGARVPRKAGRPARTTPGVTPAEAISVALPATPESDHAIPRAQRRTLLELNENTCHWPIGDPRHPDFFFCGSDTVAGLPYCASHCRVAYNTLPERRRMPMAAANSEAERRRQAERDSRAA